MDPYYTDGLIDLTWLAQILIIIAFFALLIMAIILLADFYIADNGNCKSYLDAKKAGEIGSKEHTIVLNDALLSDGIWPIAYISAAISTGFILLALAIPATIQNIMIIFLFTFIPFYAIILFVYHHYVNFIKSTVRTYIENSTPGKKLDENEDKQTNDKNTEDKKDKENKKDDENINTVKDNEEINTV